MPYPWSPDEVVTATDLNAAIAGAGGTPGGSDGYVQYNDGGSLGGVSSFTFNDATGRLTIGGDLYFENNALVAAYISSSNIDHIWHDDSTNSWNFCSDTTYKAAGNSTLIAGGFSGSGASLTSLNASNLASGTVPSARIDGSTITSLNASNLASGTVPSARISGSYTGITGTGTLTAGSISPGFGNIDITGTVAAARVQTDLIGADGGDDLGIGAGETANYMGGNLSGEHLWLGAEGNVILVTSPDNWSSGWAGRYQTTLTPQSTGMLRITSDSGYVDIGPNNASYCHFLTDRANFYFDSPIMPIYMRNYNDGSAAAPGVSFRNDTDTGMYRLTTNQLAFTAGNNTGLVVASGTVVTADPSTSSTSGYQYVLRNNTFGTLYRFTSSADLKENIATFDDSGDIIDALRPVTFVPRFIPGQPTPDDQDDEYDPTVETDAQRAMREADIQHGFIAEEIAMVAGGTLAQYEWTDDGELKPTGWRWPDMIAVLVAEVKTLRQRLTALEAAQ